MKHRQPTAPDRSIVAPLQLGSLAHLRDPPAAPIGTSP